MNKPALSLRIYWNITYWPVALFWYCLSLFRENQFPNESRLSVLGKIAVRNYRVHWLRDAAKGIRS